MFNYEALAKKKAEEAARKAELRKLGWQGSADKTAAHVAREEDRRYQDIYRPLNQELMEDLGQNKLIDAAQAEVAKLGPGFTDAKQKARLKRQAGRQGMTLSADAMRKIDDANQFNNAESAVFTLDKARINQRDYDDNLRSELINLGRGISRSGTNMLNEAANSEAARENANSQAKAANDAAKMQLAGTGLGLAAMFLL